MPASKESVASDLLTLSIDDTVWVAREVADHYIDNESVANQHELAEKLAVEGFDAQPYCRKKKSPPAH